MDRYVVDGGDGEVRPGLGVNGVAWGTRDVVAWFSDVWDKYVVDGLVNLTAAIFDNVSYLFRAVQNGLVQHYALAMLIAVLFLIGASRLHPVAGAGAMDFYREHLLSIITYTPGVLGR